MGPKANQIIENPDNPDIWVIKTKQTSEFEFITIKKIIMFISKLHKIV